MPNPNNTKSTTGSVIIWLVGSSLWFAFLLVMVFVVPAQKKTFDDFGLKVPWVTQVVVDMSMLFSDLWWVFFPLFVAGAIVAALVTFFVHRTNSSALLALWLLLLIGHPLVLNGLVATSLVQVRTKLAEGMSK